MTSTRSIFSVGHLVSCLVVGLSSFGAMLLTDATMRQSLASGLIAFCGSMGTSKLIGAGAATVANGAKKISPLLLGAVLLLPSCQGSLPKQALAANQQIRVAVTGILDLGQEWVNSEPDPAKRAERQKRLDRVRLTFGIASTAMDAILLTAIAQEAPESKPAP